MSTETTATGTRTRETPARPLAARLRRRMLDVVVIAWIAAVGLTTGRQLVDWWREDPAALPSVARDAGEDWSRRPVELRVGPRGVPIHRLPFVGSREAVEQRLMQLVQSRLKDVPAPTTPVDETERELLERLKIEPPIATDHGRGTLYQLPAPWPGVIGTIFVDEQQRLAAHGFAVPSGENKWTTFLLDGATSAGSSDGEPLPPGARPLLSWTDDAGRRVSTFRGPGVLTEWVAFWDAQHRDAVCTVRDLRDDSTTLQFHRGNFVTDIQIQPGGNGQLTGIVWTMPLSPPDALQSLPTDPLAAERSSKDSP